MASAADKRAGTLKGAYILQKETAALTHILLAAGCRVVSIPCVEAFERQPESYQKEVLPNRDITTAAEAGVTSAWYKYASKVLGVDSFGLSAPGDQVFEAKGMTVAGLVNLAK